MGKDRGFYSAADWSRVLTQSARWILGDVVRGVMQQSVCDKNHWFKQTATHNNTTDLQEYTETVTAYINKCTEDVTSTKTITVHANPKPWLTVEVMSLSPDSVRRSLSRINARKALGPDNIPGRVLRDCAVELTKVFTDIFNLSLNQAVVPTCFKATTILPVPKKSSPSCFNDYRPVALTPILMKCFKRLVMQHIKRPQGVWVGSITSSTITLNTGAPQGCVLSPLLFTLLTHDCTPSHSSNLFIKFADDTTVVGLISNSDEINYRSKVSRLAGWCRDNNLSLNVEKTKEIVVDFRRAHTQHAPLTINGASVERLSSTKFLSVYITEDLSWANNTTTLAKKSQQRLYFLRKLRARAPVPIMCTFYRGTIESILMSCITVWFDACNASC
ncbi:hypothetical protein M9458_054569 [Cirrhinus mrigala]|uniref:Reverse transcriptase domain-containing protein n=1 Tax=Cirrhinus mrigala TaxID=683832 RepID=A0ABD0MM28_CIRMR